MNCRFDGKPLTHEFVDLDFSPPSNSYLKKEDLHCPEVHYPLKLFVSERTFLVQLDEYKKADEIFSTDYAYFSSVSTSWLEHARRYCDEMTKRFNLDSKSWVVEIASNDGYLLKNFVQAGIPCLGVEPALSVAEAARKVGVESLVEFFTEKLAKDLVQTRGKANLIAGNNVFAHVPAVNDFIKGLKILLHPQGVITLEFPHLYQLIEQSQFDTIYHEHYSYYSLHTVQIMMKAHGLEVFDVEEIPTHGGSLRIYAKHIEDQTKATSPNMGKLLAKEEAAGMLKLDYYLQFSKKVAAVKMQFLDFILQAKKDGKKVVAYGAAAKGNTLLNYCGVRKDLIDYVVDASPYKQNRYMPGSHLPIVAEAKIKETKPDYILILPWNLREEIMNQLSYVRSWDAKFVTAIPELRVL